MKDIDVISEVKNLALPIFVWGMGAVGELVVKKLKENYIDVEGYVLDDKYIGENKGRADRDCKIISTSNVFMEYQSYVVFVGIHTFLGVDEEEIKKKFPGCVAVYSYSEISDQVDRISMEYYEEKQDEFEMVYQALEDEFSKESFKAYINAKIEKDRTYLSPYVILPQYFFEQHLWKVTADEVLLDGGAYNGDSIKDFLKLTDFKYKKIIAVEPDELNMKALENYCKTDGLKNIKLLQKGLWSSADTLCFDSQGSMRTRIAEDGNSEVEVINIDRIVSEIDEPVSIIKMDIEGAEMMALYGAERTIKAYHPMLYISAYHKKDDLFKIYQYLVSLYPKYKFFFRCHKYLAIDAVLYAIPPDRIY